MKRIQAILILIILSFYTTACGISFSHKSGDSDDHVITKIKSIELYMSRASLSKTEFEQYKLFNNMLFNECGKVLGGRQMSESQVLKRISAEDILEFNKLAETIIAFNKEHELILDNAGTSGSMFDAGQFYLKINGSGPALDIKTTLDSVVTASKTSEENLKKLAQKMREIALLNANQSLCGNRRFYDL